MKTLLDFVKEELDAEMNQSDEILSGGITPEFFQKAQNVENKAKERLAQDPALQLLTEFFTEASLLAVKAPLPNEVRRGILLQIFVRLVTAWENANNKFNEQLKAKP